MGLETNTLYYGDCLDWMQRWDDQSVDLIYLDPPFNSKMNYNVLFSDHGSGTAQYQAFEDIWQWDEEAAARYDMYEGATGRPAHRLIVGLYQALGPSGIMAYLTYMAERLEHMHRLLKPTGSIYYHCDPTASHYLKLLLDAIFGPQNFRNEIVWRYKKYQKANMHYFARNSDRIIYYARSSHATHVPIFQKLKTPKRYLKREWNKDTKRIVNAKDEHGRVQYITVDKEKLDEVWDLPYLMPAARERLGYPTQKPLALLDRIVRASSNPNDIVLDPFCGCGTAIEAAKNLNRQWVGVDISAFAIDLIRERRLKDPSIPARGIPYDLVSAKKLASEEPFNFESWAVTRIPGFIPNTKQVADGGVDGRATLVETPENYDSRKALAQVKGGKFTLSGLRDFIGVTNSQKAAVGCFITLEPIETRAAREVVVNMGRVKVSGSVFPRMQIWPISDYFDRRPPVMPLMTDPYSGKPLQMALL